MLAAAFLALNQTRRVQKSRVRKKRQENDSVRNFGRQIAVVATAAVPWMTGTAVNPCLRAAYLAKLERFRVTLVVPWLAPAHQKLVFPDGLSFQLPEDQEHCIRAWVQKRAGFWPSFKVAFYAARYDQRLLGIFPVGDLTKYIPDAEADIAVLEEPEHLTWFHHGQRWSSKFQHVVGVLHTNYRELTKRNAGWAGPPLCCLSHTINFLACAIHCHRIIKLSDAVQSLPRQVTSCVHGVAPGFLEASARPDASKGEAFTKGAYCLGKVVWGKGWEELIALLAAHKRAHPDEPVIVDGYGDGAALDWVRKKAAKRGVEIQFFSKRDHLHASLQAYQIFINASTSDVVATTSLEALALGKWLLCAKHPCNAFPARFRNCLTHTCPQEFSANLKHAQSHPPHPLSDTELRDLGWEAATERLLEAAEVPAREWPSSVATAGNAALWSVWNTITGIEAVRIISCAGANTRHTPRHVTDYDPEGGLGQESVRQAVSSLLPRWRFSVSLGQVTFGGSSGSDPFCTL